MKASKEEAEEERKEETKHGEVGGIEKEIPEEKNEGTSCASSSKTRRQYYDGSSLFPFDYICMHHTYTPKL
jgi:hypothetical protein